jgi:hypothetical protein
VVAQDRHKSAYAQEVHQRVSFRFHEFSFPKPKSLKMEPWL